MGAAPVIEVVRPPVPAEAQHGTWLDPTPISLSIILLLNDIF